MRESQKRQIDAMTQFEMARRWRFAPAGDRLFQGDTGTYFKTVFFEQRGGFTPSISKALG